MHRQKVMMSPVICAFHSYQVMLSYTCWRECCGVSYSAPNADQHTFEDSGLLLVAIRGEMIDNDLASLYLFNSISTAGYGCALCRGVMRPFHIYLYKRLMCVCWFFVARTTVHLQRIHSMVVRTYKRLKGRFILHFFAMRQPDATACDGFATSQIHRKTSQTFAKPISQWAFAGLRIPLNI